MKTPYPMTEKVRQAAQGLAVAYADYKQQRMWLHHTANTPSSDTLRRHLVTCNQLHNNQQRLDIRLVPTDTLQDIIRDINEELEARRKVTS